MSIIRLDSNAFQNYTIETAPHRLFVSSSEGGVEGDVALFADASERLKDIDPTFAEDGYDSAGIDKLRDGIVSSISNETTSIDGLEGYMARVNSHPQGDRQRKRQEVLRYEPGARFDKNHMSKSVIKNVLFPHHRKSQSELEWSFTNYQCLNSFRMRGQMSNFFEGAAIVPNTETFELRINEEDSIFFVIRNSSDHEIFWNFSGLEDQLTTTWNHDPVSKVLTISTAMQEQPFAPVELINHFLYAVAQSGVKHVTVSLNVTDDKNSLVINRYFFDQLPLQQELTVELADIEYSGSTVGNLDLRINHFYVDEGQTPSGPGVTIPFELNNGSTKKVRIIFELGDNDIEFEIAE